MAEGKAGKSKKGRKYGRNARKPSTAKRKLAIGTLRSVKTRRIEKHLRAGVDQPGWRLSTNSGYPPVRT